MAKNYEIALVLQSVSYSANVGSLFRIADAAGISKMFLCGNTPTPLNKSVTKVGRAKHTSVPWFVEAHAENAVAMLKSEGFHVCALEITDISQPYYEFEYPAKICLVLGNEDHGLTRDVLSLCDSAVFAPMYGKGQSLNVHVSAAVVIYHILHAQ
jgi:tRNA (guanosine-2'-O-)-methyltransferase